MQTNLPFLKKLLAITLFFIAISCCGAFAVNVAAEENTNTPQTAAATDEYDILAQGTCGKNLTWQLTSDYTLTISGTGKMYDYYSSYAPWNKYKDSIKKVDIGAEVTSIGGCVFFDHYNLINVTIGNSVTTIEDRAFVNCKSLSTIIIPIGVTSIGDSTFAILAVERVAFTTLNF